MRRSLYSILFLFLVGAGVQTASAQKIALVHFRMPDTLGYRGTNYRYPVYCLDSLRSADSVISGEFTIGTNSVVTVTGVDTVGTMLGGVQSVIYNGALRKVVFAHDKPVTGKGVLLYVNVTVNAGAAPSLADPVTLSGLMLNENVPASTISNGSFRAMDIFIAPKNPPQTKVVGDTIPFTVSGDVTYPVTWTVSDPTVASIGTTGKLIGKKVGQVSVTVTDAAGLQSQSALFQINSAALNSLSLSVPDTTVMQNLTFDLPVRLSDVTSLGIISAQWKISFNGNSLVPIAVITTGTLSNVWYPGGFVPTVNIGSSSIDVAMAGSDTLTGKGILAYVRFKVTKGATQTSPLTLQNVLFNENITAQITNGTFTPTPGPVITITTPVNGLVIGDTLTFAASGGTLPYRWSSSDTSVAAVDSVSGKVTAKKRGFISLQATDKLGFDGIKSIGVYDFFVSMPDTTIRVADSLDLPIIVSDLSAAGVLSAQMRIAYDSTKIRFVTALTAQTMSSGMTAAVNDSAGVVRLALSGSVPLSGKGKLIVLRFKHATGAGVGQTSQVTFQQVQFNEPGPTQPQAIFKNAMITVAPALNKPPVFTAAMGDTTIAENQLLQFTYKASDPDNDPLRFTIANAPAGMSLDSISGILKWQPTFTQAGQYTIAVTVNDGHGGSATKGSVITVSNVNRPPVFSQTIRDTTIKEQQSLTVSLNATDPDGSSVKYSIQNAASGMKIDSLSGKFDWTPAFGQAGQYTIAIRATDAQGAFTDAPAVITVQHTNRGPVFTQVLPDTTINEGQTLVFKNTATDPDNDPLVYYIKNAPAGMVIDSVTGLLTWTPAFGQQGAYTISILAQDPSGAAPLKISTVTVKHVNRPPVFTSVPAETTVASPGTAVGFTYAGQDPDNDPLTFQMLEGPVGSSLTAAGVFSWTPTLAQIGTHRIVVKMSDGTAFVVDTAYIRVFRNNTPPVFTNVPRDTTIAEGQSYSVVFTASDAENDPLTFSFGSQAPAGMSLSSEGILTWIPDFNQAGSYTVVVLVRDALAAAADTLHITVLNTNRKPSFTAVMPDIITFVDSTVTFTYQASDPDSDPLSFTVVKGPKSLSLSTNGTLSWKPVAADLGKDTIIVAVSDGTVAVHDTAIATVSGFPLVEVTQTVFEFGAVPFGESRTQKTIIRNKGVVPLTFHRIPDPALPAGPDFTFDTTGASVILPGTADTMSVTYFPTTVGGHFAAALFATNDFRLPAVPMTATGSSIAKLTITKRMMVDVQHNSTLPITDTANGLGALFAYLSTSGIQVTYSGQTLAPSGNDILLLVTPQRSFVRAEADSIARFLKNGGLVIALGNSAQEGTNAPLNTLLADTAVASGLQLNNDVVVDSIANMGTALAPLVTQFTDSKHPFLANVDTLAFFGAAGITVSGTAVPFASGASTTRSLPASSTTPVLLALSTIGKGKILLSGDADAWRIDSPADSIPPRIAAKDNLAFVLNVLSVTENYQVKMPAKTPDEKYRLVSIPYDLQNAEIKSVLKSLGDPNPFVWRLFGHLDPVTLKYAEYPSAEFNAFRRGEAYWLITRGQFDLTPGSATVAPVQKFFPIRIPSGYSIIGNPFPYPVSWKRSVHDSVQNALWAYNGTFVRESLVLAPFTGYFVKNLSKDSATILINPAEVKESEPKSGLGKSGTLAAALADGEWRITVAGSSGTAEDVDNVIGVAHGASDEYDPNDVSEPPATPTDYMVVRFVNRGWKRQPGSYAVDIRTTNASGMSWDMEAITARPQSSVRLSFEQLGTFPAGMSAYLVDLTAERVMPIDAATQYQFSQLKGETKRNFRIVVGTQEYVNTHTDGIPLVAMEYALDQNFPNPFNPSTQIRYTLSHSGHVQLDVYNVLGQRVRQLQNTMQPIGAYTAEWDGKNDAGQMVSTGVYFYRIAVTANSTNVFQQTKKMVLMK